MTSVLEAGFIFWGLFLVFGLIVVGYLIWMFRLERREGGPVARQNPREQEET
jgi:cbb3-type cytochrome oxidase subunit 3